MTIYSKSNSVVINRIALYISDHNYWVKELVNSQFRIDLHSVMNIGLLMEVAYNSAERTWRDG